MVYEETLAGFEILGQNNSAGRNGWRRSGGLGSGESSGFRKAQLSGRHYVRAGRTHDLPNHRLNEMSRLE